ncbi:MAG: Na/Pi symporter [bacterium]|nr:Na/Pi symporter [bacterium]MCM1374341.1 Na/Pi symporter [Muribaculum sp.]
MRVFLELLIRLGAGVGIFLYGLHLISSYLEELAGPAMEKGLKRFTGNPCAGALTGTVITALVQSSTAVTVMTVSMVDKGIMTLEQAVGVILGANVGTAGTGIMAALPIRSLAPVLLLVGAILALVAGAVGEMPRGMGKKGNKGMFLSGRIKLAGALSMGLGMLLLGMELMQEAMAPYRSSPLLTRLLVSLEHPVGGVLGGAVFTALIQSSSASVAILQSLAAEGMVTLEQSAYIVYGQNIGTCATALWASIRLSPAARSCARLHLLINLLGAGVFLMLGGIIPLTQWVGSWTPGNPALQIANLHLFFNLASTLLLLPFSGMLVKIPLYISDKKCYGKA